MKVEKIEKTVRITDHIHLKYVIERAGQEQSCVGDRVIVKGTLHLPTSECLLIEKINFGDRVNILGEYMYSRWGTYNNNSNSRCITIRKVGVRWNVLFTEMEEQLTAEIQKLSDAVSAREKVLNDAEID